MHHLISYDLARALHIISVIAWISGLLMLPRFYAYITASTPGGELETFMLKAAKRLRSIIITPAMILTWVFGLYLFEAYIVGNWDRPLPEILAGVPHWFWVKFALVFGLSGYHGFVTAQWRKLASGERKHSEKFWRAMSEVPFIVAICAVLLATLEPSF
jgi:protoporphyrinogen IX oxidase